jgi:enoyl-CoA hydratase/carnithine racemase
MSYESIILEHDGPVARITLNRPDRLNSFTAAMHDELKQAFDETAEARVVILSPAPAAGFVRARTSTIARCPAEAIRPTLA